MASETPPDAEWSGARRVALAILYRVVPFLAALGAIAFTYAALRGTWRNAAEMATYVGASAETIRLLIVLMIPIAPTTWMVVVMLYLGVRANRDLLPNWLVPGGP